LIVGQLVRSLVPGTAALFVGSLIGLAVSGLNAIGPRIPGTSAGSIM